MKSSFTTLLTYISINTHTYVSITRTHKDKTHEESSNKPFAAPLTRALGRRLVVVIVHGKDTQEIPERETGASCERKQECWVVKQTEERDRDRVRVRDALVGRALCPFSSNSWCAKSYTANRLKQWTYLVGHIIKQMKTLLQ